MNQRVKLTIKNIHKSYNGKTILDDISFEVYSGEFLSILGPSGCGKTTLLRILIGITDQDGGRITKDGVDISHLSADKRGMGIVFQNYALFPNMTVLENVAYPLKINKFSKKEAIERARAAIDSLGLSDHLDKRPGTQQEVGITFIFVTHDQEEAFSMSNRIMVMSNGAIEQLDTPFNIYHHPANAYIEEFVVFHLMEKLAAFRRFTGK